MEDGSDLFLSLTGNYTRSRWLGLPLDAVAAGSAAGPSPSVPQPLACLLAKLSTAEALATPGLFIHTVQEVLRPAGRGGAHPEGSSSDEPAPGRVTQRALLTRLWPLVEALEGGGAVLEVGLNAVIISASLPTLPWPSHLFFPRRPLRMRLQLCF